MDDGNNFLADIDEKTLKELDQRLAMAADRPTPQQNQNRHATEFAPLSLDPERTTDFSNPSAPAFGKAGHLTPDPDEGTCTNFLAELEQEVAARNQEDGAHRDSNDKARQLHEALSRIFVFFNQLSRYANQLEPEISRLYRLDAQTAYSGLRWHGAFVDYRKQDMSENARLSHVSFRVRLEAPQAITLVRRWDQLEALKRDLNILNLNIINDTVFSEKPEQEFIQLQLAPDFPVQLNFKGNYKAQRIDLLCRNLEGFCISAFVLDIHQVNQSLLEELGRFLLSRSNTLPQALLRVNYVPPSAKKP